MDSATKEVLLNILRNLKVASEMSYATYEAMERTRKALQQVLPDFDRLYHSPDLNFDALKAWRDDQIRQLDAAIQLVQAWV